MWTEGVQGFDILPYEDIKWYYISHILSGVSMLNTKLSSYDIHIYGWLVYIFIPMIFLVGGFNPTPLKNDGLRQLGWWLFPTEWKVIKFMFQTTNQPVISKN